MRWDTLKEKITDIFYRALPTRLSNSVYRYWNPHTPKPPVSLYDKRDYTTLNSLSYSLCDEQSKSAPFNTINPFFNKVIDRKTEIIYLKSRFSGDETERLTGFKRTTGGEIEIPIVNEDYEVYGTKFENYIDTKTPRIIDREVQKSIDIDSEIIIHSATHRVSNLCHPPSNQRIRGCVDQKLWDIESQYIIDRRWGDKRNWDDVKYGNRGTWDTERKIRWNRDVQAHEERILAFRSEQEKNSGIFNYTRHDAPFGIGARKTGGPMFIDSTDPDYPLIRKLADSALGRNTGQGVNVGQGVGGNIGRGVVGNIGQGIDDSSAFGRILGNPDLNLKPLENTIELPSSPEFFPWIFFFSQYLALFIFSWILLFPSKNFKSINLSININYWVLWFKKYLKMIAKILKYWINYLLKWGKYY